MEKLWIMRESIDIKLITIKARNNYLVSKPNYHSTKFLWENLLAIKMRKTQILMNKPIYLSLSILEKSKKVIMSFRVTTWNQNKEKKKIMLHRYQ